MKNIIIIGGGNQSHYTIDIIEKEGKYNIIGIIDSIHDIGSDRFGYKILGRQENINEIIEQYQTYGGLITIGDNWSRYYVYNQSPYFFRVSNLLRKKSFLIVDFSQSTK